MKLFVDKFVAKENKLETTPKNLNSVIREGELPSGIPLTFSCKLKGALSLS